MPQRCTQKTLYITARWRLLGHGCSLQRRAAQPSPRQHCWSRLQSRAETLLQGAVPQLFSLVTLVPAPVEPALMSATLQNHDRGSTLREFVNCTQCLSTLQLPPLRSVTPNLPSLSSHSTDQGKETLISLHCVLQLI